MLLNAARKLRRFAAWVCDDHSWLVPELCLWRGSTISLTVWTGLSKVKITRDWDSRRDFVD